MKPVRKPLSRDRNLRTSIAANRVPAFRASSLTFTDQQVITLHAMRLGEAVVKLLTTLAAALSRFGEPLHRLAMWALDNLMLAASLVAMCCGDANRMAKDVDAALYQIVEQEGCMDRADAVAYVKQMTEKGRYLRDVY